MRNGKVVILLLITMAAISSLAYASSQSPKDNDKVTLTVKATVKASAHNAGGKDQGKLDDKLTVQLTETVEYMIKSDDGAEVGPSLLISQQPDAWLHVAMEPIANHLGLPVRFELGLMWSRKCISTGNRSFVGPDDRWVFIQPRT